MTQIEIKSKQLFIEAKTSIVVIGDKTAARCYRGQNSCEMRQTAVGRETSV